VQVPGDGSGVEAAARNAISGIRRLEADFVALAHHLDDQVETFLLQLLRGAGPKGLAAMPVLRAGRMKAEGLRARMKAEG
jgi:tRNA(Ile)-lysidine synthase